MKLIRGVDQPQSGSEQSDYVATKYKTDPGALPQLQALKAAEAQTRFG